MSSAVPPRPYRFDESVPSTGSQLPPPSVVHSVFFDVVLLGFTPLVVELTPLVFAVLGDVDFLVAPVDFEPDDFELAPVVFVAFAGAGAGAAWSAFFA